MEGLDYHTIFGSSRKSVYDDKTIEAITRHRKILDNTLMFDRLLNAVGIQNPTTSYPPHNNIALRSLVGAINNPSIATTYALSLLYYLRKDTDLAPHAFAKAHHLPAKYITLIDGLWLLDRLRFEPALASLTDPKLIPTFAEEILITVSRHAPPRSRIELVLGYYDVMQPGLASMEGLHAYFGALASASVTQAFFYTRRQPEHLRRRVFEELIRLVIGGGGEAGEGKARRCVELVALPFDDDEEVWFDEFLIKGKGKGLHGARDSVMVRKLALGKADDVKTLARDSKERRIDGVNWHDLAKGLAW